MTQNIYDDEDFFAGYSRLRRSVQGLDGAPEWPALRAMLPPMQGLNVLDLGCGFGWFSRWARTQGAARILAVDVSERMLGRARADTSDPAIAYARADLEAFDPLPASFDLAYSALAFHYIAGLDRLLSAVHRSLVPNGRLVFSVEHPIYTAPAEPRWTTDANGRKTWPIDGYLCEGPRSTDWLTRGVIKQHRTIATYLDILLRHGFTLLQMQEWSPTDQQIAAQPDLADERHRPMFLLLSARRA